MAKCKFCGEPVKAAPVAHAECMEKQLNDMEQDMRLLVSGALQPSGGNPESGTEQQCGQGERSRSVEDDQNAAEALRGE